jgi:hypothetical protein
VTSYESATDMPQREGRQRVIRARANPWKIAIDG